MILEIIFFMENDIVYFACNDWNPNPKESMNLCYNYLMSYNPDNKDIVNKNLEETEQWLKDNKICINCEVVDMSVSYYITAQRKVFETYFVELLPFIKNEPYDFMWKGDNKCFLEFREENIGFNFFDFEEFDIINVN